VNYEKLGVFYLGREFDAEIAALGTPGDPATIAIRSAEVTPRKSDIAVAEVSLVWTPWRTGADGFPARAAD
jgi:hypothetical protein